VAHKHHKFLPVRVALSPTQSATATGLHYDRDIKPAIESGALPVYLIGNGVKPKRRVLVSDLEQWLRNNPQLIRHLIKR
jgi:hypothetical protein